MWMSFNAIINSTEIWNLGGSVRFCFSNNAIFFYLMKMREEWMKWICQNISLIGAVPSKKWNALPME